LWTKTDSFCRSIRYKGCFYNPEFHRNNKLSQVARIKRRAPPTNYKPKKAQKVVPRRPASKRVVATVASRKALIDSDSEDDEWEPTSAAGITRVQEAAKVVTVVQEKRKSVPAHTPVPASRKRRSDCTPMDKMFQMNAVSTSRVLPHPGAPLPSMSRGRSNMTPGNFKDSIMNFDALSPSTPMSPFLGRLIRQESTGARRVSSAQPHPGDAPWSQWYQMGSFQWPHAGIEGSNHPAVVPVPAPHTTRTARSLQLIDRGSSLAWAPSPLQGVTGATHRSPSPSEVFSSTLGPGYMRPPLAAMNDSPSPSEVFSATFGPSSMRPPLASVPPLLSRDSSLALPPVALVQRASSSFYLPFMGLSDTLTSALATPAKGASVPTTSPMFTEAV
jgi:hypothetical protein